MIHLFHHQTHHHHPRKRLAQAYGDDDRWQLEEQPTEEQLVQYLTAVVSDNSEATPAKA